MNTKWSYTDQLNLKMNEKLEKEYQIAQKNLPSTSSLSSSNKEVQIQKYNNKDRQHHSDVQHQQEIRSDEQQEGYGNYQKQTT
jgi:translation initiation factor 2 beta subunit (eIF-2beta)/eIF-5